MFQPSNDFNANEFDSKIKDLSRAESPDSDVAKLSDLSRQEARRLHERWPSIAAGRRHALMRAMLLDAREDIAHNYERAFTVALSDPDQEIRIMAVEGLWEADSLVVLDALLVRLQDDSSPRVRAAVAQVLGHYAHQAETTDFDIERSASLQSTLVSAATEDQDATTRFEAMCSAAYFSDDPAISALIQQTYDQGDEDARAFALRAMARQVDSRWTSRIAESLANDDEEVRLEAAKATATSGGQRLVPRVIDLAVDDEDAEVRLAAIEALGEIGGDQAVGALRQIADDDDETIASTAQEALDAARLLDDVGPPPAVIQPRESN